MKLLEELESKVLQLIQKNKDLQGEIANLKQENIKFFEQNKSLQGFANKNNSEMKNLSKEREAIKSSIEELLGSMELLEKTSIKNI